MTNIQAICYAPTYSVTVTIYSQISSSSTAGSAYESIDPPVLLSSSPAGGAAGATLFGLYANNIKVFLSNSTSTASCGNVAVFSLSQIAQQLTCTVPLSLRLGSYTISLMQYQLTAFGPSLSYTIVVPPTVSKITTPGGLAGKTTISIQGSGFGNVETVLTVVMGQFIGNEVAGVPCLASITSSLSPSIKIVDSPIITSFAPKGGKSGSLISISGSKFIPYNWRSIELYHYLF